MNSKKTKLETCTCTLAK